MCDQVEDCARCQVIILPCPVEHGQHLRKRTNGAPNQSSQVRLAVGVGAMAQKVPREVLWPKTPKVVDCTEECSPALRV
jgi:hypothetical protein